MTIDAVAPGSYKLTETVLSQIEGALRATAEQGIAAKKGHITPPTFRDWMAKGQEAIEAIGRTRGVDWQDLDQDQLLTEYPFRDQPFLHFFLRCERAVVDFILQNAASISISAQGDTQRDTRTTEKWEPSTLPDGKPGPLVLKERTVVTIERRVKHWQAAAWMLERRFPDLFARTIRQEVTGAQGGPVQVDTEGARLRLVEQLQTMKANDQQAREVLEVREVDQAS